MTDAILQIFTGFLGSLGFAILYNIRGKRLIFAALGGLLSWGFFLILNLIISGDILCYYIVAVLISLYAEILARLLKTPTTTFIMTSLIPLVPGSSLYYTMTTAFSGNMDGFIEKGLQTLGLAGALAAGIITVAGASSFIKKR